MNYRHAFHAGNFADVLKHIVLVRVIEYLKHKPKPFRFIDTHAGVGIYDLASPEAMRSPEWQRGIARIIDATDFTARGVQPGSELDTLLEPYIRAVKSLNVALGGNGPVRELRYYPGAGEIVRRLLRAGDRAVLNELHDHDSARLADTMRRDKRVRTLAVDGWDAVKSLLPPPERRGVTLIDPSFEEPGEFQRLEKALDDAVERFATGTTMLWYPIKAESGAAAFRTRLAASGHRSLLAIELRVRHRDKPGGLNGSALIIHNPPFQLEQELALILPWLSTHLADLAGAGFETEWLAGE